MAYFAPAEAWRDLSKGVANGWGCLLTIANIASFTLPLVAAIIVLAWPFRGGDARRSGWAVRWRRIAALIAGIGFVTDRRDTVGVDPKIGRLLGVLHLVPSTVGAVIAVAAVLQDAAVGGIGVDRLPRGRRRRRPPLLSSIEAPRTPASARWERNLARLQKALDAMPPDERARVYSDIQHALEVLGTRGLLPDETLIRAMDVPIGMLGMTMAPRDDLKPGDAPGGGQAD